MDKDPQAASEARLELLFLRAGCLLAAICCNVVLDQHATAIFRKLNIDLPTPTETILGIGGFFRQPMGWACLVVLLAVVAILTLRRRRPPSLRACVAPLVALVGWWGLSLCAVGVPLLELIGKLTEQ